MAFAPYFLLVATTLSYLDNGAMAEFRDILRSQLDAQKEGPRPILTSLNGDNGWLMSFPRPPSEQATSGKTYYHVVFEPWLGEPITVLSPWFLHFSLTENPEFPDAAAVEAIVEEIEAVAGKRSSRGREGSNIDAIFLGFHYDDHTHKTSLMQFDRHIPVFATPEVMAMIKPWGHFITVALLRDLAAGTKTWKGPELHPGDPLPPWLTILRLRGHAALYFCTAIVWTHVVGGEEVHEAIMITPHGIRLDDGPLQAFLDAEPRTEKLAMMCALKEAYAYGALQNLGVKGGLALYRHMGGARHWVLSHHQTFSYEGCLMRLLNTHDVERTFEWGLEEERIEAGEGHRELSRPTLVDVKNGSCFVLS